MISNLKIGKLVLSTLAHYQIITLAHPWQKQQPKRL